MKIGVFFLALFLAFAGVVRADREPQKTANNGRERTRFACEIDDPEPDVAARGALEFAGIVPGRGLSPEDFANGGLLIEVDESLYQVSANPAAVIRRAADFWEIPGTMIKFRVGGPGGGGNKIVARRINAAARATIGQPGWGARGILTMTLDVPFSGSDDTLASIIAHELGHWLGFDHSFLGESVMFPTLTNKLNWIDPDHTAKATARYAVDPNALGECRGRITRGGQPLSGARINLIDVADRTIFGTFSQPDGTYFLPVYSGTYRLFIDPNDGPAVAGNFRGTYPGGPLDYPTVEAAERVVISAGVTSNADVDVPTTGDAGFKITTAEPRTVAPGDLQQQILIYYVGASPSEIASVESFSPDVQVKQIFINGGEMAVYLDIESSALPGQHTFLLRKNNGAIAVVVGVVGVVGLLRLPRPHYSVEAAEGAPLQIAWESSFLTQSPSTYVVSSSLGYGSPWEEIGRVVGGERSLVWQPDPGLSSPALRFRVEAFDAVGFRMGVDESLINIGLGQPARGDVLDGPDTSAPEVEVLAPNGGETFAAAEALTVAWLASDDAALSAQTVEASTDGGRTWVQVAALGPSARAFVWTAADKSTDGLLVRVTARDVAGNQSSDTSDAAARLRQRPVVTDVSTRSKGDAIVLKIQGDHLAVGATVALNGAAVAVPVKFNATTKSLKLKGSAASLGLNPPGTPNTIVVTVDGLSSPEASF